MIGYTTSGCVVGTDTSHITIIGPLCPVCSRRFLSDAEWRRAALEEIERVAAGGQS